MALGAEVSGLIKTTRKAVWMVDFYGSETKAPVKSYLVTHIRANLMTVGEKESPA